MKKILAFVLAVILVFALIGRGEKRETFDIGEASKIEMRSGTTGETFEITDAEEISYITDNINALTFSKEGKNAADGWSYSLKWFDKDGNLMEQITLMGDGHTIVYDGYIYRGMETGEEIDLSFLEEFFLKRKD